MEKQIEWFFLVSDTRGGGNYTVRRLVELKSSGEIFGANQGKVILDRKVFTFIMQVIDICYLDAAGGYAEGRVLDILDFLNQGW